MLPPTAATGRGTLCGLDGARSISDMRMGSFGEQPSRRGMAEYRNILSYLRNAVNGELLYSGVKAAA